MAFCALFARRESARRSTVRSSVRPARAARPRLEALEDRTVPYAASGNFWPNPQLVTISFVPDGTNLGGTTSNLFAAFNARFGSPAAWQNVILKAAQSWAQVADINFALVSDSGADSGSGDWQQGDPTMGDIRIGGFNFQDSGLLALGYMPPSVNNYSVAGDIGINTARVFNINGNDYDLYTVMAHEVGHALGLDHSLSAAAIMYSTYAGVDTSLGSDDIAGIQSIYGPRQPDMFDAAAANGTFAAASDITSQIAPDTNVAQLTGLDITANSDVDYYKFTAPDDSSGTMTIRVQSAGLSLLAPSLRVYNASQQFIGIAIGTGYQGSTPSLTLSVTPGSTYYIRVAGANASAFGTGAYALTVNLGGDLTPAAPVPDTATPNGDPLNGGGGLANRTDSNGLSVVPLLVGLDRTVNRLTGGLLGGVLGNVVDKVVSAVVQLPFVDAYEVPVTDGADVASPVPTPIVFRQSSPKFIDLTAGVASNIGATIIVPTATPRDVVPTPSRVSFGIGNVAPTRTGLELLDARSADIVEPIALSSSTATPVSFAASTILSIATPRRTMPASLAADRAESNAIESQPVALLSMFAVAVGLNPPVSADERRRPLPG